MTTRQRQRELVYRLRSRVAPTSEEKARRRQQSNWNGNNQGATNDSTEEFKASVSIVDRYPVEYSCRDDPRQAKLKYDQVSRLEIEFDYEMITVVNSDVIENIRSLEWSLLWNVARNMGLLNCNVRKQQEPLLEDGIRHLIAPDSFVVGLSSLELDTVDDEIGKDVSCACFIQFVHYALNEKLNQSETLSSFFEELCTVKTTTEEGSVCTPMVGRMTAQFMGDESIVRSYLEHNIKLEMNSNRVRIDNVEGCVYVGDRYSFMTNANAREEVQSKNKSTNLALVFGVLVGVFVLGFAVLMTRGRRTRQQHALDDDDALLHSIPTVIVSKPDPMQTNRNGVLSSSSSETQESASENIIASCPSEPDGFRIREVSFPTGNQLAAVTVAQSPDDQLLFTGDTEITETTTPNEFRDKENLEAQHSPTMLVAPVDTAAGKLSKTLQPKRRRRKKKKRRVLKKVSSRSSIDEMETIKEDDESIDSEFGSDFDGSEYSSDDEEDTISPKGDCSSVGTEPSAEIDAVIPPSPIREEPRIRRLPPPWI